MIGFPKYLSTKRDYINILNDFSDTYSNEVKNAFQILYDSKTREFILTELEHPETGLTDDTHRVISSIDSDSGINITKYYQLETRLDPNCKLFKIGFTLEEVEHILSNLLN